ncbi:MAG: phosphoribosyl transferase [Bacteroidaceae bacterium]|nr:phosphoribosyl transferase [Bacteroidaceae bacterium]
MRYVTIAELSSIIRKNLWKIPHEIDLVVGIPRSGLMVANMIALYLNKRLTDIDTFVNGRVFECGERGKYVKNEEIKKILVVDDSVFSGKSITKAKTKLGDLSGSLEMVFLSPIVTSAGKGFVDIFFEVIDDARFFEWNLFHHSIIENTCFDIDGVLCCDPIEDDDGEKYLSFLTEAKPMFIPTVTIDTLITCRLEKYRKQTEEWLQKNGVSYRHLVMLDFPNKAIRVKWGKHGEFKGDYYKNSDCWLFVESSYSQACIIARVSNKPVICVETNELLHFLPKTKYKRLKGRIRKYMPRTYQLMRRLLSEDKEI